MSGEMEDLDDLDSFLGQAVTRQSATDALTKARNSQLGAIRGSEEWRTANAYVQAWERKNEWHPVEYQARLEVEVCTCGHIAETFEGFFTVARHKVKETTEHKRVRVADVSGVDLGRINRVTERRHVEICIECWATKGKSDEEKAGEAGTSGSKNAGHDEGESGLASVVERRGASALWSFNRLPAGAGKAGLGEEGGRGDGE